MKKIFLFIFLIGIFLSFASAKGQKVNNERIHYYESTRTRAMGATYSSDFSFFDNFLANPALLPYMGRKRNISGLDLMLGTNAFSPVIEGVKDSFSDYIGLCKDLFENGNVNLDVQFGTPLMGGYINNGFGWQFASVVYAAANVTGLNSLQTTAGDETTVQFGYGYEMFNFDDRHRISVGVGIKTAFDLYAGIKRLSDIPKDISFGDLPLFFRFALGADLGTVYRFSDWFSLSVACRDVVTPYVLHDLLGGPIKTGFIRKNLVFGTGFFLPTERMGIDNIITSWNAFIDLCDFTHWFNRFDRNPWLNVGIGTELCLFRFMFLRAGIYDLHWHTGIGFKAKLFRFDVAVFGRELGIEPNSRNQAGFSFSFRVCE